MARIGAFHLQQSALLNLQRAQGQELAASERVSTGRKADDLQGFGRSAEAITALRSVQARVETWQGQAQALTGKLELQDAQLVETLDAAGDFRTALQEALAMDRSDGMVNRITAAFERAAAALNGRHQGQYLFGGARLEERPFAGDSMAQLTTVPAAADLFNNDNLKSATRLDEGVVVETGQLASEVGGELMEAFRRFQAFLEGPDGALTKNLTPNQRAFIETEMNRLAGVQGEITTAVGRNGVAQSQVESAKASLDDRSRSLKNLIASRTEVDLAQAVAELQQAQIAVEATAKVFTSLKDSSLLDLLR